LAYNSAVYHRLPVSSFPQFDHQNTLNLRLSSLITEPIGSPGGLEIKNKKNIIVFDIDKIDLLTYTRSQ